MYLCHYFGYFYKEFCTAPVVVSNVSTCCQLELILYFLKEKAHGWPYETLVDIRLIKNQI